MVAIVVRDDERPCGLGETRSAIVVTGKLYHRLSERQVVVIVRRHHQLLAICDREATRARGRRHHRAAVGEGLEDLYPGAAGRSQRHGSDVGPFVEGSDIAVGPGCSN